MRCVNKLWNPELNAFQLSCTHHKYTSTGYLDTEAGVWCGILEGIEDSVIWDWVAKTEDTIEDAFCNRVHEYLSMCHGLGRIPQVSTCTEFFEPDSEVVCEIDGGATRLYIDDTANTKLILSIKNPKVSRLVQEYHVNELIIEEQFEGETPIIVMKFLKTEEDKHEAI